MYSLRTKTLTAMKSISLPLIVLKFFIAVTPALSESTITTFSSMTTEKKLYRIPKVSSTVKIDAVLDEPVWQDALVVEIRNEILPGNNTSAPVKAMALLSYGETDLYVAFQAHDPDPSQIRATVTDRDNCWNDDFVGVRLDTFNDSRNAFDFFCNPYGIQSDSATNSHNEDPSWDTIWESHGQITENGYIVEMAIPFSSIKFQPGEGDQIWGFEVVRSYPRNVRHIITAFPWDRNNNNMLSNLGKLIGFSGVKAGKNIEIDPTFSMVASQERKNETSGGFVDKDRQMNPGFTARWGLTPNMMLSAAVNPDFSNIEADNAQMDINTQFALYYQEKRPFFLEGAELFKTRLNAVYTRTLADPSGGIKMTGKEGKNAIGFFSARDELTNILMPGSQGSDNTSLGMQSYGSVLRYKRDVGASSAVGFLLTDREGQGYFNRLAGFDGDLKITPKDQLTFQVLGSQTSYPGEVQEEFELYDTEFSGTAVDVSYRHSSESYGLQTGYRDFSPDFRADLGFISQVGYRRANVLSWYNWRRESGSWFNRIGISGGYAYMEEHNGQMLGNDFDMAVDYSGPLQTYVNLNMRAGNKFYNGKTFDTRGLDIYARLRPTGTFNFSVSSGLSKRIDYANTCPGNRFRIRPSVEYKFGSHLIMETGHNFEFMNVSGGRLYTANVSNVRLVYQFNKRSFIRTNLQYVDYRYNISLYEDEMDPLNKKMFTQVLYSYKINPQTVFYLGY